ncbi:hypothetical protein FKM82_011719 [Ascaphus truei]
MKRKWLMQQDNNPKHTSRSTKEWLQKKKIHVLEWPSQSSDLNPIKMLWQDPKRAVRVRKLSNVTELAHSCYRTASKFLKTDETDQQLQETLTLSHCCSMGHHQDMHRRFENAPDSAKTKALQTVIEMKDSKITSMERGLRDLEDEIQMLKCNGALSTEEREEEMKQMEVYRSHSKFMKNKVEQLREELNAKEGQAEELKKRASALQTEVSGIGQVKQDLSRKDTELMALQTKLETLTNQFSDSKQHVEVLKESLSAKEQRAAILQTEVDALRLRLEEKETMLNKKTKQIQEMSEEKGTQSGEIHDLKDMLDVKERKVIVLQKKDVTLQKDERIEELEEALRESVQITAEREMVLAQEESARTNYEKQLSFEKVHEATDPAFKWSKVEELMLAMEKVKQELESMKAKLSSTQQSLAEKEVHLTSLRAERRKHLEEVLEMKQEALLAAISEKDANIALLELSSSKKKKTQEEVASLKREKDRLVQQLKQQTQNRMKLMADNYEVDNLKSSAQSNQTNHKPSPDQMIQPLIDLDQNRSKLKLYVGHLTALCQDRDPQILHGLHPPDSYYLDDNRAAWEQGLQKMTREQLNDELEKCEHEGADLQEFANTILQQIADHCPDILEQVVNALEESS